VHSFHFVPEVHPEKSQTLGLKLIANFLKWKP
jgi:imidazoleglycerol phosphate synthase glutamine amidotransferase subunit HisH